MNAPDATPPDVSLVVPVRNEAGNIGPLIAEIRTVLDGAGLAWELFVINDGSNDTTRGEIDSAAGVICAWWESTSPAARGSRRLSWRALPAAGARRS